MPKLVAALAALLAIGAIDRLSLDFTYFSKKTEDVIINQPVAPSSGFAGNRPVNLGRVDVSGIELSSTFQVLQLNNIGWELRATYATNEDVIKDLGGVPSVISLAFWGGVWGILFALIERKFARRGGYWVTAFLFGAVLPSLVALLVVLPLKGQPVGGGWQPHVWFTAFLVNGAWGIGTGVILRALLTKIADLCKTLMEHFLREIGEDIDMIKIGDDLGMQNSFLMSPKMYREIVKPFHADYISFIKSRTNAKLFFHTDGDVFPLIPDFIEMGVDVLNPIQTSAGKMSDLEGLKKQFGKNLVFCGAIDTHRVLPFGTPDEVRAEVRRVIDLLGRDGGYMVASVHTIMPDVPPANVLAMVDAVEEFGWYS